MNNADSTVQIIPYYSQPHVFTVIRDNTYYEETVATPKTSDDLPYSTVIVTGADKGIDNTFVRLTDLKVKKEIFGQSNFSKYGQPSLQADALFNGYTNVWFCRVLPDNALYANIVVLAHYRKGKILDELGQETGKSRMEIKFSLAYASKPYLSAGAKSDSDIEEFGRSLASKTSDPKTGYLTVPLCYIRSIGKGKYGNDYSISITRDSDREKEYDMKMYAFNLISNETITKIKNVFSGSFVQTARYGMSTLISDVLDQYSTGSCPISIFSYEDSYEKLFQFYTDIVRENAKYIQLSGGSEEDLEELNEALAINETTFDPLFGLKLNTRTNESIPYYKNYTIRASGKWKNPDLVIPNNAGAAKPLNISEYSAAFVGARILVIADPLNAGSRWLYTIIDIDRETGNIIYDDGVESPVDEDQYDGINISQSVGHMLDGGSDGDFEEITVGGETRAPSPSEMKLLLSKEYVKAFRGTKDRKILSPARVNLDFIFDANYNLTADENIPITSTTTPLYNYSTILTDRDSQNLSVLANGSNSNFIMDFTDLNVKKAIYDLNEFRNRDGMTINLEQGAGCSLYLDCGLVGLKSIGINYELMDIISMMEEFTGRQTSIDLGYYEIFDPTTSKRIKVTTSYFLAKNLIPHLVHSGLNIPFVNDDASLFAIQMDKSLIVTGDMIRGSFRPDIDLIDWDVKERLYKSRINYYVSEDEGKLVQRAVQNTRQMEASCLLEENNVRVLNLLKKNLDRACRRYEYHWNDPVARKGYTDTQMKIYRPWIGTLVEDLVIRFEANEWEQERMIMHCYVEVKFKDIIKRIILEINISRPTYSNTEGGAE